VACNKADAIQICRVSCCQQSLLHSMQGIHSVIVEQSDTEAQWMCVQDTHALIVWDDYKFVSSCCGSKHCQSRRPHDSRVHINAGAT
jgi:hypothetical protein